MATLEVCQDSFSVLSGCRAVDCFDADIGVAQRSDLVILFPSEMTSCR